MIVENTHIPDLLILSPRVFEDQRGYFFESFRADVLADHGVTIKFIQDNESMSNKGVLRGLHMQAPPFGQAKLIKVVKGAIYDVAVDVRKASPTYGQYFGIELNGENRKMLYVPEGFAHGFCCLQDRTIVQYKCSNYYHPSSELGLRWDDMEVNINWPVEHPIISAKDEQHPFLKNFHSPF